MRITALLLSLCVLAPFTAEARAKKRPHAAMSAEQRAQRDRVRRDQARNAAEAARAEAELADLRAGRIETQEPEVRTTSWVAQENDREVPPGFARR